MGVYFEESPGAVAYQFNGRSPMALAHERSNVSVPAEIGEVMAFDTLTFPYDFSIAAYLDTSEQKLADTRVMFLGKNSFVCL